MRQLDLAGRRRHLRCRSGRGGTRLGLLDRGVLWKRKGLFWRERVFLLTSAPRFVYYDCSCDPPEQKGAIPWTYEKPVHCRRRSATHFDVVTEHRDYHLAAPNAGGADGWIRALHDASPSHGGVRIPRLR